MPPPRVLPNSAARVILLVALTLCAVAGVEWVAFGWGVFWRVRDTATGMHPRWTNLMDAGARRVALRQSTAMRARFLVVGSSIAGRGFDPAAFDNAWETRNPSAGMTAELVWLGGSTLADHIVLAQYMGDPPPAYTVLAFARRDVMINPTAEYALGVRIFHTPRMLSLDASTVAPARPWSQQWWPTVWPGYRYRMLAQQLTLRYRPGLRKAGDINIGLWGPGAPDEIMNLLVQDSDTGPAGINIALVTPWAAWCRSQGTQPVLWALPVRPDQLSTDLHSDGATSYITTMEAAADGAGVWFVDSSGAGHMTDFSGNDRVHIYPEGAARVTQGFANALADLVAAEQESP